MKKALLLLLPAVFVAVVAGVAFSRSDSDSHRAIERHSFHGFPHDGYRLGIVMGSNSDNGIRIDSVVPDSPADKAGLQKGDMIISLNGDKVDGPDDVRELMKSMDSATPVSMEILRNGKQQMVSVTPEKGNFFGFSSGRMFLGVNLQELNADLASYFQVNPNDGVLVTEVEDGSPAEKAGIRSGDVISSIDGTKVKEAKDVMRLLENVSEGGSLEVTVLRHGSEKKLTVQPEKREGNLMEHFEMPEIPEIPQMQEMLGSQEFQRNMDEIRQQVDQMKQDMELRKQDMQMMKKEIQENLRQQMEQLREDLHKQKNPS